MSNARIRMYNVGFGDCFLVTLTDGERPPVKVLFDCGSHAASKRPRPMKAVVKQILADVCDEDGVARIDVVIGTHRHQDHVSGFNDPRWAKVEVREVWMPWTEDPSDPEAKRIRERQSKAAERLALALTLSADHPDLLDLATNQLTNAAAMKTLHEGFATTPTRRFLPSANGDDLAASPLGRFGVHILGPSRDDRVIRDMDPPTGESYLRMIGAVIKGEALAAGAFPADWMLEESDLVQTSEFSHLLLDEDDQERLTTIAVEDRMAVAVALDKAVNGTSLILAFEIGDQVLLFPADAQWGSWKQILDDAEHRDLVSRTTFLKVGHHGSHNATPRDFVELLAAHNGAPAAMVSTHTMKRWPSIPKTELLDALIKVTPRLARSDAGAGTAVPGFAHWDENYIDLDVPLG
jgi:beta-lactamase superfamily II metal-dependent hydrolase